MFFDNDEDAGAEPAGPMAQVLTVVSLIFGGLSIVALLHVDSSGTSWVLNDILAKWDRGLQFAFGPLGAALDVAVAKVRALGFDASIRPDWPHVVLVAMLVGLNGIAVARGWFVVLGVAWLLVCLAAGFVFLSGVGWSSFASLEVVAGANFGARLAVFALAFAGVGALVVRLLLVVWPELVFDFFVRIERWLGPIRVATCFIGAGLILTADSFGQLFWT